MLQLLQVGAKIDKRGHYREPQNCDRDEPIGAIFRVFWWRKLIIVPVASHDQFLPFPIVAITVLMLFEFKFDLAKTRYMLLRRNGSGKFCIEGRFLFNGQVIGMLCSLKGRLHRLLLNHLVVLLWRGTGLPNWIAMLLGFGRTLEPARRAVIPAASLD